MATCRICRMSVVEFVDRWVVEAKRTFTSGVTMIASEVVGQVSLEGLSVACYPNAEQALVGKETMEAGRGKQVTMAID